MTPHERHRQNLLWTIRQWMRMAGFYALLLSFGGVCLAAEVKSSEAVPLAVKPAAPKAVAKTTPKAPAQAEKKKDEKTVVKTLKGTVMFIRRDRMSVEFSQSGDEGGEDLLLSLDKKLKLKNVKDFSKIRPGDEVRVKYVETYLEPQKKGQQPIILSMVGNEIELLRKANSEALSS